MQALRSAEAGRPVAAPARLKISEVFYSLQGEATTSGAPTLFIRLTGCPLRCGYCDTAYAFHGGVWRDIDALVDEARNCPVPRVCVTGGEPLVQQRCLSLLTALCDAELEVSLETSGAVPVEPVDPRVRIVLDIKTPGSGEVDRNLWDNLGCLKPKDAVKFVLCDRADFDWSVGVVRERLRNLPAPIFFSPSYGQVDPGELAEWILESGLDVRLQVQLHKTLWGETPGR